jgi:hypothetical protein
MPDKSFSSFNRKSKNKSKEINRARNKRIAQKMGITIEELSLLYYAKLKAQMSAKSDETLQQTEIRAMKIWREEVDQWNAERQMLINHIMSLPENQRKIMMNRMRKMSD